MTDAALIMCGAVAANCVYAIAGLYAATRYGIQVSLLSGAGLAVLLAGTVLECAAVTFTHDGGTRLMLIAGFGAVVAGAACDASCGYVFDAITLPCLLILLAVSLVSQTFTAFAFGVLAAGGALFVLYVVTFGRGLGLGDVKLACCIGGAGGALAGIEAIGTAFVLGGAYAAVLLATKRARFGAELRFAPYLAAGMALVVLHGGLQ